MVWPPTPPSGSSLGGGSQQMLLHFAQRIARKFVDDDKSPWAFKGGKFFAANRFERVRITSASQVGAGNDVGYRDFAAYAIGLGCDGRFGHLGLFHEKLFDLARIDVEDTRDNQIATASAQGVVTVGRALRDVTGFEPASDERGASGIVTPPVSGEHV